MRVIHLCRKPLSESSVAANVLEHGAGGLNIDACRAGYSDADLAMTKMKNPGKGGEVFTSQVYGAGRPQQSVNTQGRWPANVILQHQAGCRAVGSKTVRGNSGGAMSGPNAFGQDSGWNKHNNRPSQVGRPVDADGNETVAAWSCAPGCPVADLDAESGDRPVSGAAKAGRPATGGGTGRATVAFGIEEGNGTLHADKGGASRYFKQVGGG